MKTINSPANNPLLTIAIPTFNRAHHLQFLLSKLEQEISGLEEDVLILVSDNASTDETPAIVAAYERRLSSLRSRRNATNEGPDNNICACYLLPETPHVWVLGDDDAPLPGMLRLLVNLLRSDSPDILYLPSRSSTDIQRDYLHYGFTRLNPVTVSAGEFASMIHVQMTFISGFVFRKSPALTSAVQRALDVTRGTCLVQLAWVFETLKGGSRFLLCRELPMISTTANSGGYEVYETFMVNHTRIVSSLFIDRRRTARSILNRTSLCFLPGLVWHVRNGSYGKFQMQQRHAIAIPPEITCTIGFQWLVEPVWSWPRPLSWVAYQVSRVVAILVRRYDHWMAYGRHRSKATRQ